jgi:hypothetical protein
MRRRSSLDPYSRVAKPSPNIEGTPIPCPRESCTNTARAMPCRTPGGCPFMVGTDVPADPAPIDAPAIQPQRMIEGYCTREVLDVHGDVVRLASIGQCDARLWRGHGLSARVIGAVLRAERRESAGGIAGLFVRGRIDDAPTWRDARGLGFSIEFFNRDKRLHRICLVPEPACPGCEITRAWTELVAKASAPALSTSLRRELRASIAAGIAAGKDH